MSEGADYCEECQKIVDASPRPMFARDMDMTRPPPVIADKDAGHPFRG